MFGSKTAWGIDIGESAVRAAKLKVDASGAQILALDVIPRAGRAEGYSYLDKEEQIRDALCTFVQRNKIGSASVAVSAPGAGFDRFISLPAVSAKQIAQIVKYEARQNIPFPLEEVAWDYQLASDRAQMTGEGVEVALFAIKIQIIEQMLANLSVARLGVDIIGMSRLALFNFLKYDRQVDDGTIIIDVGAGSTDIVILAEGNFRVRSIPISGEAVTKMLQQKFGISYEEAEELKKKASQSKQPEKLFDVMRPTFERLLGEIHKTIGYYKQQFKTLKLEQAFLLGESFKMHPLVEMFAESLGCKVSALGNFQRVAVGPEAAASPHAKSLSSFTVAMGLALQAAGQGPVTINVLPEELRVKREVWRKKPFAIATAACLGVGLVASFFNVNADSRRLAALGKEPEAKIAYWDKMARDFAEATDTSEIKREIGGLSEIGESRGVMLQVINEISKIFGTKDEPENEPGDKSQVPIGIFLTEVKMEEVQPEVPAKPKSAFMAGLAPAEEDQADKAAIRKLTIKGRSEMDREVIYKEVVERLEAVDIFTIPQGGVEFEVERLSAEEAKPRLLFTVHIDVTPPQHVK